VRTNVLYYGDNLHVLRERIPNDSVDLIYLDPPFSSARDYFVIFKDRTGKASEAQSEAFGDTWVWGEEAEAAYRELCVGSTHHRVNPDLAVTIQAFRTFLRESPMMAYLVSMAIRLHEMKRVLKPNGSLYLHCDSTASHYLKVLLDTIFTPQWFRNEIIWKRTSAHNDTAQGTKRYGRNHDVILFYAGPGATWNPQYMPYDEEYVRSFYKHKDPDGRLYRLSDMTGPGGASKGNPYYEVMGVSRYWRFSRERMEQLISAGRVVQTKPGSVPQQKRYLDEMPGVAVQAVWDDIKPIGAQAAERLGYPTQKPLALLERIIRCSSNPGDVVMDTYCGCGTTVMAAHGLARQWVGIDITAVATCIIKARLEQTFGDLAGKVEVIGLPMDLEGARTLFEADSHQFQIWACTLIGAYPNQKKGADKGIDGWMPIADMNDHPHRCVVQVKGGKPTLSQIRDFCHVVTREKAAIGFFVTLGDITPAMKTEAVAEGFWDAGRGQTYPKVQLLSVAELMTGLARPKMPTQEKRSILGYMANRQENKGLQPTLELD
jgi:DNA modification methylase